VAPLKEEVKERRIEQEVRAKPSMKEKDYREHNEEKRSEKKKYSEKKPTRWSKAKQPHRKTSESSMEEINTIERDGEEEMSSIKKNAQCFSET